MRAELTGGVTARVPATSTPRRAEFYRPAACRTAPVRRPASRLYRPPKELPGDYRKGRIDWNTCEIRFPDLMRQRGIEETVSREVLDEGCLLCSEDRPRHRRPVAEYPDEDWGGVRIEHPGMSESD